MAEGENPLTLEDVHRSVANVVANLKGISEGLDLREPFLEILRSFLDRLLLRLHQVERVTTLASDGSLQRRHGILEEGVSHVTDTRGVVTILVIVGKGTPFRPRVNDSISNLRDELVCDCRFSNRPSSKLTTRPQDEHTMSPLLNSSTRLGGYSLQSGHIRMLEIGAFSLYSPSGAPELATGATVDAIVFLLKAADGVSLSTSANTLRSLPDESATGLEGAFVFDLETENNLVIVCPGRRTLGSLFRAT